MVFKCQEDSFLKTFTTKVISCNPVKFNTNDSNKKEIEGYEVVCEDTILFPEGGGQPSDHGYMNDKPVYNVLRSGDKAIHYVADKFTEGEEVNQIVEWDRRFDHMQQHSGQHLISAIFENELKFPTVSWWLGEEVSYIELDTPTLSESQIRNTENRLNALIRENRGVEVKVIKNKEELEEAHTRGLPEDHIGDIRVIIIDGIDNNMCCGTHVTNLSQLQAIKLLTVEKSKRKNKCLLNFLVGNRVFRRFEDMLKREQELTKTLNNGPFEHLNLVKKQMNNVKSLNKALQNIFKEIAIEEAKKLKTLTPHPKYFILHKKEADLDFMSIFIKELNESDILLFLSVGDASGNFVLYGPQEAVSELGNSLCTILDGKGSGKGNKFQAKVNNMANKTKANELVINYFKCDDCCV